MKINAFAVTQNPSLAGNATAPKDCPMPYVELAGLCLAFVTWADQGWAEARQTCHGLSGELAAITDIEQLRAVYLYLHQECKCRF